MFEHDYIMRQFLQLFRAIERISQREKAAHTMNARDKAKALDDAIGDILSMDGSLVLRLAPESLASIVRVSGIDPRLVEYLVRTLLLAEYYFRLDEDMRSADMRREQAHVLAKQFGFEAPPSIVDGIDAFEHEIESMFVIDGGLDTRDAEEMLGVELIDTLRRTYDIPDTIDLPDDIRFDESE